MWIPDEETMELSRKIARDSLTGVSFKPLSDDFVSRVSGKSPPRKTAAEIAAEQEQLKQRMLYAEKRRNDEMHHYQISEKRRTQGLCSHCGGEIGGVFVKKCKNCACLDNLQPFYRGGDYSLYVNFDVNKCKYLFCGSWYERECFDCFGVYRDGTIIQTYDDRRATDVTEKGLYEIAKWFCRTDKEIETAKLKVEPLKNNSLVYFKQFQKGKTWYYGHFVSINVLEMEFHSHITDYRKKYNLEFVGFVKDQKYYPFREK